MNKIYNLKWDPIKGMLIPVSELATLRSSSGSNTVGHIPSLEFEFPGKLKTLSLLVIGVIASLNSDPGYAYTAGGTTLEPANDSGIAKNIAIGEGTKTSKVTGDYAYSVAIGSRSEATGTSTVALGDTAIASGFRSSAIGAATQATAENTVALGFKAK
ncbi:hypothetical protein RJ498_002838 [Pluralibacter gergoviae]